MHFTKASDFASVAKTKEVYQMNNNKRASPCAIVLFVLCPDRGSYYDNCVLYKAMMTTAGFLKTQYYAVHLEMVRATRRLKCDHVCCHV